MKQTKMSIYLFITVILHCQKMIQHIVVAISESFQIQLGFLKYLGLYK